MNNKDILKKIEQLNLENIELLNSKEYKLGNKIYKGLNLLRKGKILKIIKSMINNKKIKKLNNHEEKENLYINNDKLYISNAKVAVYTCITGDYDEILEPLLEFPNIDFYLFSDNIDNKSSNVFKIKQLPENMMYEPILSNRYVKFHPHELFKDYDYAIYIDGNIRIIGNILDMINAINIKTGLALHRHQFRDCIYKEIEVCRLLKKGNYPKLKEQVQNYKKMGFPEKFGMLEANVIVTDLKNNESKRLLEEWWQEFKASESFRDQISLPYIIWKNNYTIEDIGNIGYNVYKNPKIRIKQHIK